MDDRFAAFLEPPAEASPTPMWFWNDAMDADGIRARVRSFRQREVRGFVLHPRMGLPPDLPYLSDRFLDLVEVAVEEAARLGMRVVLYDEGMYPSGSAHGEVVRSDPAFAAQSLVLRILRAGDGFPGLPAAPPPLLPHGRGTVESLQRVAVDPEGGLRSLATLLLPADRRLAALLAGPALPAGPPAPGEALAAFVREPSGGTIRGVHPGEDSREPGAPAAANLLDPDAVDRFVSLTHERYYARLARFFGTTVVAMFTDEPSLLGRGDMTGRVPWTAGLLDAFPEAGLTEADLPALFDGTLATAPVRRRFDRLCRRRLEEVFFARTSAWCAAHGIALTGHPAEPDALSPQRFLGIPGQDLVLRRVAPEDGKALEGPESTAAKGVADSARLRGRRRSLVECFGCCVRRDPGTGWDLPMEDLKWYVDWLAVRGVDWFVPHAFYESVRGARAHERPPDLGPHSLWWDDFAIPARHMARLSGLLLDSGDPSPVAVLAVRDRLPYRTPRLLYEAQVPFVYLEEDLLPVGSTDVEAGWLRCDAQRFGLLLVEDPGELDPETRTRLDGLRSAGLPVLETGGGAPGPWLDAARALVPFRADPPAPALRLRPVHKDGARYLLCVNEGDGDLETALEGSFEGPVEAWDAWEGTRVPLAVEPGARPGTLRVPLSLGYRESRVLAFGAGIAVDGRASGASTVQAPHPPPGAPERIRLPDGPLVLRFPDEDADRVLPAPADWCALRPDACFSGTARYEAAFVLSPEEASGRVVLDLGAVGDDAAASVGGRPAGRRWWRPYRFDLTGLVAPGRTVVRIDATNSLTVRMDRFPKPSGVLGPAVLRLIPSATTPALEEVAP